MVRQSAAPPYRRTLNNSIWACMSPNPKEQGPQKGRNDPSSESKFCLFSWALTPPHMRIKVEIQHLYLLKAALVPKPQKHYLSLTNVPPNTSPPDSLLLAPLSFGVGGILISSVTLVKFLQYSVPSFPSKRSS